MKPELKEKLIALIQSEYGYTLEDAIEHFTENYQGEFEDLGHYAESFAEDCGDLASVPKQYRNYIDFDAIGRDMDLNGDIFTIEDGSKIHVFWSR